LAKAASVGAKTVKGSFALEGMHQSGYFNRRD
jgi:hypothetical protein